MTIILVAMARRRPFAVTFDPRVKQHLNAIEARFHSLIRATIQEQLRFERVTETRDRKPLQQPATLGATWEIRFGPENRFRVLYSVDLDKREVEVLAVGVKVGNRLLIGGEEVRL